jgi:hypothetical protein
MRRMGAKVSGTVETIMGGMKEKLRPGVTRSVLPAHLRHDPDGAQAFADAVAELADVRAELLTLKREREGVTFSWPPPRDTRADAFAVQAQAAALKVALAALR